ncbi:DNA mismatch endonuclease Vsr [Mesorhizobium sp. KR1-2]|uniref:very short patch repair endonuclease n=1 Tax=Mesorhizobium sp. KR1-2 TaxID=3156609 RepID=UPI0032B33AE9
MDARSKPTKNRPSAFPDVPEGVRERMARIRKANTKPELLVRSLVHRMGYRYRLHRRDLPGTPDLTFPSLRKVIFVHGCFWHRHDCKLSGRIPETRRDYWGHKLQRNVERDQESIEKLHRLGWDVLVVWECETKDIASLMQLVSNHLGK